MRWLEINAAIYIIIKKIAIGYWLFKKMGYISNKINMGTFSYILIRIKYVIISFKIKYIKGSVPIIEGGKYDSWKRKRTGNWIFS